MDKIHDFLKELRTRFSSPFFSSFIIAWLIINWRVPVALLFYKTTEWIAVEGSTYIGYIEKSVTFRTGVLWPLIGAFGYTIIAPVLKNLIRTLNAYLDSRGTDWSLRVARAGKISVEKYMELRDDYKEKVQALLEVYEDESKYRDQNRELQNRVEELRKELGAKTTDMDQLKSQSEINRYNGHWQLTYLDENQLQKIDTIYINSGDIRKTDRGGQLLFKITRIGYTSGSAELTLTVEDHRRNQPRVFYIVFYRQDSRQAIFISREANQPIDRMARVSGSGSEM
jgi:hypothetical protein